MTSLSFGIIGKSICYLIPVLLGNNTNIEMDDVPELQLEMLNSLDIGAIV